MTVKETAIPAADEDALGLKEILVCDEPDRDGEGPDDTVEVDYEGRTYTVPRPLKAAVMRQGDYTRKTQELANARKGVAAGQAHLAETGGLQMMGLGRLHALDRQIAPLAALNWGALAAQDSGRAQALWRRYAQLKTARDQTARALQQHHQSQALDLQRARVRQVEEGRAKLRQDIEDWSPQTAHRILQAGKAHGFSDSEIHSVTDPRMILVLNKARLFDEQQQRQAQAKRLAAMHDVKPAVEVGAAAPATGDPSRMSTAEWMRWRAGNLRKRH